MFDGKQIAKLALQRAEELEHNRKMRNARLRNISALGLSAAALAVVLVVNPLSGTSDDYTTFDDNLVPLAEFTFPRIDENSKPFIGEELYVSIPEIGVVTVSAATLVTDAQLYNPQANTYVFIFELILSGTEESLYKSELVEPGMCIESPALERAPEQGDYNAVLRIHLSEPGSSAPASSIDCSITLYVD